MERRHELCTRKWCFGLVATARNVVPEAYAIEVAARYFRAADLPEVIEFFTRLAHDLDPSLAQVQPASTERTTPGPQALQVLDYLRRYDGISQLVATEEIGTTRLAARIRELRVAGHKIERVMKRSAKRKPYGYYRLVKEAQVA